MLHAQISVAHVNDGASSPIKRTNHDSTHENSLKQQLNSWACSRTSDGRPRASAKSIWCSGMCSWFQLLFQTVLVYTTGCCPFRWVACTFTNQSGHATKHSMKSLLSQSIETAFLDSWHPLSQPAKPFWSVFDSIIQETSAFLVGSGKSSCRQLLYELLFWQSLVYQVTVWTYVTVELILLVSWLKFFERSWGLRIWSCDCKDVTSQRASLDMPYECAHLNDLLPSASVWLNNVWAVTDKMA